MKKTLILLLITLYFIPFLFIERDGVMGVVTDSWVDENMMVSNLVYMEDTSTILLIGKTLELGEHYYFEHPNVSLKDLITRKDIETLQLVLQSSDTRINIINNKRLEVSKIKSYIITEPNIDKMVTECDLEKYRVELLDDYYSCNFIEGDSIGHPVVKQSCQDMIAVWKRENPEIIFSLPKDEWFYINSRIYRAENLMDKYTSYCKREMIPLKGIDFQLFGLDIPEEKDWDTGFDIYYFVK